MSMPLKTVAIISVVLFSFLSIFLFVHHEVHNLQKEAAGQDTSAHKLRKRTRSITDKAKIFLHLANQPPDEDIPLPPEPEEPHLLEESSSKAAKETDTDDRAEEREEAKKHYNRPVIGDPEISKNTWKPYGNAGTVGTAKTTTATVSEKKVPYTATANAAAANAAANVNAVTINNRTVVTAVEPAIAVERKGALTCQGKLTESEVIYWKVVPGDKTYESPITPHHGQHHDRYLTFEYDQGGWNNVRMGLECFIVLAHAMGRTLVVPPQQHLYLLGKTHKDEGDTKAHDEMGFEDFFDVDLLQSHEGYHVIHMEDFLAKEAVSGGLHGVLPPGNSTEIWGPKLWNYLKKVADEHPEWMGHFIAFPDHPGNFTKFDNLDPKTKMRMQAFGGERIPVHYDEKLQRAHHLHFPADGEHRLLQHHYAFAFFANQEMQSFYRRFVRDYMRYKDIIQCGGHAVVAAVREDARKEDPTNTEGVYYALHIRRGDFQYKEVKHSASKIVQNLQFPNGTPIIPPGHIVYLSTDDPQGICENCYVNRKPCTTYSKGEEPPGCPPDPSWDAFRRAGWKLRFLDDYLKRGMIKDINPNQLGMVESIVCSKAKAFAGTYYSTFTGYIHRLRGYHGLGEDTYYHTSGRVFSLQLKKSVGHGFPREWRAGWTDDGGELI